MTVLESFIALDTLNLLALLGVVFIGLPHGAMDGALAMHFGWTSRPAIIALFLFSYIGLAGAVVLVWMFAPAVTFVVFLAISIYHFGRGDASSLGAGRTASPTPHVTKENTAVDLVMERFDTVASMVFRTEETWRMEWTEQKYKAKPTSGGTAKKSRKRTPSSTAKDRRS